MKRLAIVGRILFAIAASLVAVATFAFSLSPTSRTSGTVVSVHDDECTISFTSTNGDEINFVDSGGRWGCERDVGEHPTVYYPSDDPSDADTVSPTGYRLSSGILLAFGAWMATDANLRLHRGEWSRTPRAHTHPQHRKRRRR
jgi:hypothetical protein